jgi:hypothetical protein
MHHAIRPADQYAWLAQWQILDDAYVHKVSTGDMMMAPRHTCARVLPTYEMHAWASAGRQTADHMRFVVATPTVRIDRSMQSVGCLLIVSETHTYCWRFDAVRPITDTVDAYGCCNKIMTR